MLPDLFLFQPPVKKVRSSEGACHKHVHQQDDAKRQYQQRQFLHFQSVFSRRGFARHASSLQPKPAVENGPSVAGTAVTSQKYSNDRSRTSAAKAPGELGEELLRRETTRPETGEAAVPTCFCSRLLRHARWLAGRTKASALHKHLIDFRHRPAACRQHRIAADHRKSKPRVSRHLPAVAGASCACLQQDRLLRRLHMTSRNQICFLGWVLPQG